MIRTALLRSLLTASLAVGGASLAEADWFYCYSDDGTNVYFSKLNSCPAAGPVELGARFREDLASRGKPAGLSLCPREANQSLAASSRDRDIESFRKRGRQVFFDDNFFGSCVRR